MVKEFEPERSHYSYHSVRIIADMNADVHHGRGSETTEEIAVTIMASLVKKYLESGKDVGLAAAGDRIYRHEPGHNVEHEQQLFRSLAVMKAQGHIPFARFLAEEAYRFDAGSAVIVVMPAEGQDIAAPLQRAAARGTLVNIILLDSASYGGWTFAQPVARNLASRGLNTYIIRRGDDIASALDSRLSAETAAFAGSEVY